MPLIEALPKLISWAIPLIILAIIILPQAIRILREGRYVRAHARRRLGMSFRCQTQRAQSDERGATLDDRPARNSCEGFTEMRGHWQPPKYSGHERRAVLNEINQRLYFCASKRAELWPWSAGTGRLAGLKPASALGMNHAASDIGRIAFEPHCRTIENRSQPLTPATQGRSRGFQ